MTAAPWVPCPHRSGDPPRCGHAIRRRMIVLPALCAACPIVVPAEPVAVLPCVHRGERLREERCKRGCPSERAMVPIHACGVRGECSVRGIERGQTLPCCVDCPERDAGET